MSRIPTTFEYNGASYEFDIRDADQSERFEAAVENMQETEKTIPKDGKNSVIIRAQCDMIKSFFDSCFGEGAGTAICTDKSHLSVCYDAYDAFLSMVMAQKNDVLSAKNTFAKYSNREQRRAAAHKKK